MNVSWEGPVTVLRTWPHLRCSLIIRIHLISIQKSIITHAFMDCQQPERGRFYLGEVNACTLKNCTTNLKHHLRLSGQFQVLSNHDTTYNSLFILPIVCGYVSVPTTSSIQSKGTEIKRWSTTNVGLVQSNGLTSYKMCR